MSATRPNRHLPAPPTGWPLLGVPKDGSLDHPALDDRLEQQAQPSDAASEDGSGDPDPDRPDELGDVRRRERRNVGDGKREVPEAGP